MPKYYIISNLIYDMIVKHGGTIDRGSDSGTGVSSSNSITFIYVLFKLYKQPRKRYESSSSTAFTAID